MQINNIENLIKNETTKVSPLREKNIENLSKLQRLNLELKSLDEESDRTKKEIENIKNSLKTIEEDIDREKSIVIDAKSNEKRLREEKNELIEIDSKYYETEKQSNEDLDGTKNRLKIEIDKVKFAKAQAHNDPIDSVIHFIKEASPVLVLPDQDNSAQVTPVTKSPEKP